MTVNDCTHPNLIPMGTKRCNGFVHCPTCGFEESRAEHVWVPAGIDDPEPRVCAYCNVEQMSDA